MSYLVFARKYRPQTFDDVIGQSHITTTLRNAIAQSRVAHAYLFAGPRGVGKTTTARILAKALNCEKGPTAKPCNKCASCAEITGGSSLDILEIDGASNRGIDEIRSLRENVKFAPSKGRFRLYIIDEVHMLTPEAFNALLKTLEEPPPHIKFIFATTSPHKVPATILSRCQRFDFRPLASGDIAENLRKITDEEKFEVSDEALGMIARYADGSMRDAQVILDQVTSFGRGKAKAQDVTDILGIVDDEVLFGLSGAIALRDAPRALAIIDRMADEGKDHAQVALGLIEHFRNIAVAKISPEADSLIDAGPDKVKRYRTEAERFTLEEALYVIYALSNTVDMIRRTTLGRIPLEAALIKLTKIPSVIPLGEMLSRIEALESQAGTAAGPGAQRAAMPARAEERASPAPGKPPAAGPAEPVPAPAADAGPSLELEEMSGYWAKVVSYIKPKKMSIASYLEEGSPVAIGPGSLTVGFPKECQFHKDALDSPENKRLIEEAVREVTGLELKVTLTVTGPAVARRGGETAGTRQEPEAGSSGADETDPVIRAALDIFGGKISGANGGGSAR